MSGCLSLFWGFEHFLIGNLKHDETEDHRFSGLSHPLFLLSRLAGSPPIPSDNRVSSNIGERLPFLTSLKHCLHTGEDPLVDDQNERDINSVAGVLKLYFRGLENPLFPKERFQDLISTISKYFPGGTAPCSTGLYRSWSAGSPSCQAQERDAMREVWASGSLRPSCVSGTMDWWTWYIP